MNEFLLQQFDKYDLLVEDAVKFIYQGVFGGGHLIFDVDNAKKFLLDEIEEVKGSKNTVDYPLIEKISKDYSRLHLSQLINNNLDANTVFNLFYYSSVNFNNNGDCNNISQKNNEFFNNLKELIEMSESLAVPLDYENTLDFVYHYLSSEDRLISHSDFYRKKYQPHYRVIKNSFAKYIDVFCNIDKVLAKKGKIVIAIDGKSGSGKSLLAEKLGKIYDATIFHADDYFLPKERKTPSRMAEIGGNIDYERMKKEIFDNLSSSSLSMRKFDCKTQTLKDNNILPLKNVVIIEGSYCSHPYFDYPYDLKIFLDVDEKLQKQRITNRNGEVMLEFFLKYWIPMENAFFDKFKVKENSHLVYNAE